MEEKNNNLVKCKSCGKEISKNAETCPYCGEPSDFKKGLTVLLKIFLIIIGLSICFISIRHSYYIGLNQ